MKCFRLQPSTTMLLEAFSTFCSILPKLCAAVVLLRVGIQQWGSFGAFSLWMKYCQRTALCTLSCHLSPQSIWLMTRSPSIILLTFGSFIHTCCFSEGSRAFRNIMLHFCFFQIMMAFCGGSWRSFSPSKTCAIMVKLTRVDLINYMSPGLN